MPGVTLNGCELKASRIIYVNTIDLAQMSALDNLLDIFKFTLGARNGELTENQLANYVSLLKGDRKV